jgi:hypothetical protein
MGRKDLKAKIRLEGDSKGATKAIGKVQKSFSGMASKLKVGAIAVVGALASMAGALKAIEAAGERLGQKRSLERTLKAQGISIDEFVGKLKDLANNQIATSDLVLASNRALALGIASDDLPGLLEAATKASVALGISATQAFNDITTGVGRASPLILDNLGIVVDATRIYKDMAAEIGVSVEQLTKQQKTAALSAAVMENAAKGAADFAAAQSKVTVAIAKSKTELKEWYERATDSIAQNEALADSISRVTREVNLFITALRGTASTFLGLVPGSRKMGATLKASIPLWKATTSGVVEAWLVMRTYGKELQAIEAAQESQRLGMIAAKSAYDSARKGMEGLTDAQIAYNDAQEEAEARTKRIEAGLNKEATALSKLAAALGEVTQLELEKELNDITTALDEAREATDGSTDAFVRYEQIAGEKIERLKDRIQGLRDGLGDIGDAADDSVDSFEDLGDAVDDTGDSADDTGDSFDDLSRSVRSTNSALSDQARQAQATGRELKQLSAINETLALAEARTALAATKEARKNITGVGSQRDSGTSSYGLSEFGTGGKVRVNPDGTLRPA